MQFHKKINRFLAESMSVINAIVAVGIPSLTVLVSVNLLGSLTLGVVVGGVAGIVIACAVCGVLAVLLDIRDSLSRQADTSRQGRVSD